MPSRAGEVLHPIPGEGAATLAAYRERPVVAFAGSLHAWNLPVLDAIATRLKARGGEILLITPKDNAVWTTLERTHDNVRRVDPFARNEEAIDHVGRLASAFLVSYSPDPSLQRWGMTSFPSKLVDFSRTGIPMLIVTPRQTALWRWAERNTWPLLVEGTDGEALERALGLLADAGEWTRLSRLVSGWFADSFEPSRIHDRFRAALLVSGAPVTAASLSA